MLDPVYTGRPSTCSTSYMMWQIIKKMSAESADVFFRLLVPRKLLEDEAESAFVNQMPDRVKVIPYGGTHLDRMREHWSFSPELAALMHPSHDDLWDVDVVLSSRMAQLDMFRFNSARPVAFGKGSTRVFIGLEEMPMYEFSKTVLWTRQGALDLMSLSSAMSADAVVVNSLWAKSEMLQCARQFLSPSRVRELEPNIYETLPVKLQELNLHTPKQLEDDNRPAGFNVAFCGRITGTRNFKDVAELFRKQFSFPLGKGAMKFVISTNSQSSGSSNYGDISMLDFEMNNREQFHEFLKTRAHVAVNLSTVEDFSLSTYEPLLMGVPMIVADRPWSQFLGKDYPFRVKTEVEAYAWINAFAKDYAGTYALFQKWHDSYWKDFVSGPKNKDTATVVSSLIHQFRGEAFEYLKDREIGQTYRDLISDAKKSGLKILDINKMLRDAEMLAPLDAPPAAVVAKTPSFQMVKMLAEIEGYVDTNETGVMALA